MSKNKSIFEILVQKTLDENIICSQDNIVVGVSGGPDSMFLLELLRVLKQKINFNIFVAHINHQIRKEAKVDEALVQKYCAKFEIPFFVLHADVLKMAKEEKQSTEACGRNVRYNFFKEIMQKTGSKKLAVAHNMGDNAETVLLNILRGAGLDGMVAMQNITYSNIVEGYIIRPVLDVDKSYIIQYLEDNDIPYAIDVTNLSCDYTRNKIRNNLIPNIQKEYNPNIVQTLNRMSYLANMDVQIIDEYISEKYDSLSPNVMNENTIVINADIFNKNIIAVRYRLIRKILEKLLGNVQGIELIHIQDICELIQKCITGKKYIIGNKFEVEVLKKHNIKFTTTFRREQK